MAGTTNTWTEGAAPRRCRLALVHGDAVLSEGPFR